jgi:hypothetical protein
LDELVHSAESEMKFVEKHNAKTNSRNVVPHADELQGILKETFYSIMVIGLQPL